MGKLDRMPPSTNLAVDGRFDSPNYPAFPFYSFITTRYIFEKIRFKKNRYRHSRGQNKNLQVVYMSFKQAPYFRKLSFIFSN